MTYTIRRMRPEDVAQVAEIDREAFPTLWPPVNYQRELENSLAYYLVACDEGREVDPEVPAVDTGRSVIARVRRLFKAGRLPVAGLTPPGAKYIAGFAGTWIMAGEAHITNIAVREAYRRQGIGELLLIATIDLATSLEAHLLTLEVRASNDAAQALYSKYGFSEVGVRRGYYIDNKEDAVLMSTGDITAASFQGHLEQLRQTHSRRLGIAPYRMG